MTSQEDTSWQIRHPSIMNPDGEPPRCYPYQCNICCLFLTAGIEALEEHVAEHRSKLRARLEALQHEEGSETGHMWDYLGGSSASSSFSVPGTSQQQQFQTHSQTSVNHQTIWYPSSANRTVHWTAPHGGTISVPTGSLAAGTMQAGPSGTSMQDQQFGSGHLAQDTYSVYTSQPLYNAASSSTMGRMLYTGASGSSSYTISSGPSTGMDAETAVTNEQLQGPIYRGATVQYTPNATEVHVDHIYLTGNMGEAAVSTRNVMYYSAPYVASMEGSGQQRNFRPHVLVQQDYENASYSQQREPSMAPTKKKARLETPSAGAAVSGTSAPPSFTDPPHAEGQVESIEAGTTAQFQSYQQEGNAQGEFTGFATESSETDADQKHSGQWNQSGQTQNLFAIHDTEVAILADPSNPSNDQLSMQQQQQLKGEQSEISEASPQAPPPPASTPITVIAPNGTENSEQGHTTNSESAYLDRLTCSLQMTSDPNEPVHPNHSAIDIQQQEGIQTESWISAQFLDQCAETNSNKDQGRLYGTHSATECELSESTTFAHLNNQSATVSDTDQIKDGSHFTMTGKFKTDRNTEQTDEEFEADGGSSSTTRTQAEEIIDSILNIACLREGQETRAAFKEEKSVGVLCSDNSLPVPSTQMVDFTDRTELESREHDVTEASPSEQH